jgi:hypothetical protein
MEGVEYKKWYTNQTVDLDTLGKDTYHDTQITDTYIGNHKFTTMLFFKMLVVRWYRKYYS